MGQNMISKNIKKTKTNRLLILKTLKKLAKNKHFIIGAAIVSAILFICIFAPLLAPHDPVEQNLENRLLRPNIQYPLGTDNLGRCILSRLLYGARVSMGIAAIVVAINATTGAFIGLVSGYFGGFADSFIMRIVDILLSLPAIILALLIAGILGPSLLNIMLAMTIVGWTGYARVVRSIVLSLKNREFVEAEVAMGASPFRIMFYHILPNTFTSILVLVTLSIGYVILAASALSFIGLGSQPPAAEWGSMLSSGRAFMRSAPHVMIFPGLAIMLSVMGFNFLGNGLRDVIFNSNS